MKILVFQFMGEEYQVNEKGHIKANGLKSFSDNWIFLGGTRHHWGRRIEFNLQKSFEYPLLLNGCLGWDSDHGTTRQWGGSYYGKLPRISNAHLEEA